MPAGLQGAEFFGFFFAKNRFLTSLVCSSVNGPLLSMAQQGGQGPAASPSVINVASQLSETHLTPSETKENTRNATPSTTSPMEPRSLMFGSGTPFGSGDIDSAVVPDNQLPNCRLFGTPGSNGGRVSLVSVRYLLPIPREHSKAHHSLCATPSPLSVTPFPVAKANPEDSQQ